jgi:hypothetical protein
LPFPPPFFSPCVISHFCLGALFCASPMWLGCVESWFLFFVHIYFSNKCIWNTTVIFYYYYYYYNNVWHKMFEFHHALFFFISIAFSIPSMWWNKFNLLIWLRMHWKPWEEPVLRIFRNHVKSSFGYECYLFVLCVLEIKNGRSFTEIYIDSPNDLFPFERIYIIILFLW